MKKIIVLTLTLVIVVVISGFDVLFSSGIAFRTGSPYDKAQPNAGTGDCSTCHSGGATAPTVNITANPAFGSGNSYIPGATYTLSVVCSGYPKFGFGLEILNSNMANATDAGTFGNPETGNCKKVITSGKPTNMVHTDKFGTNNTETFSFTWTAPSSGPAYVYCCVNGVNGTGDKTGDKAQTLSMVLTGPTSAPSVIENTLNASIFPNPAHDFINFNYSLKNNSDVRVEIFNMEGKKVGSFTYNNQTTGEHLKTINLSELSLKNGIYSISFYAGNEKISKTLVLK
ncbi:MAG TPA: choice-of-anchor V domain-containing protein [Bacteroidia bacterium]|nr:choice-of-anchor V domain-containing protein [Bacteroidia bacterium]HNO70837.1 T9SS type A sorting domain-containing protein [Bacteroidia bacterium]